MEQQSSLCNDQTAQCVYVDISKVVSNVQSNYSTVVHALKKFGNSLLSFKIE